VGPEADVSDTTPSMLAEARVALAGRGSELGALSFCAFLTMCSYEMARPAVESLFLERYGQSGLPWVWLSVAGLAFVVVGVYNRLAVSVPVLSLFVGASVVSVAVFVLLVWLHLMHVSWAPFALYIAKDLYVVVLVEAFWSMANLHFTSVTARWAYGIFCAAGSLGAVVGGVAVGRLAAAVGTVHTLWVVVAIIAAVGVGALFFGGGLSKAPPVHKTKPTLGEALKTLDGSPYLGLMVLLVAASQLTITLIDYEFNGSVATAFPLVDERTRVIGYVYSTIAAAAFVLQLTTGVVLRTQGVARTLVALPLLLMGSVAVFVVVPVFGVMAVAKVASKAFDYSLFRAAKEMLYIPLGYREKTEGKAVVDMLTYRVAKGGVSAVLLGLAALGLASATSILTIGIIVGWIAIALAIGRRYALRLRTGTTPT
jgi:ATP:ADP antiporter, AAA family